MPQSAYYMRVPSRLLISVLLAAAPAISQAPARTAADIPSIKESHEGFTVEAAPWTSKEHYKARFPKKTPMDGGAIAIDVVLRNDSDQPLHVNLNRIRLLLLPPESDRQQIYPLSPADLADLVFHPAAKQPTAPRSRVPLPIPRTGSGSGKSKQWDEFRAAADSVAIGAEVVAPHASVHGLLYFDLAGQFDLMEYARLYVPEVTVLGADKSLLYFDLDLSQTGGR